MKISSLADFIPEFRNEAALIINFDQRIFDKSSRQDKSPGVFSDKYKIDCDHLFDVIKRINLEHQEAQDRIVKISADESYNSIVKLIKTSEERLSSELSEVLEHFVSEETVRRILCKFSSFFHNLLQDQLVEHLAVSGNRNIIEQISYNFGKDVFECAFIDDENEYINIKNRNTTVVLDLSHFKSYLKEKISLEK